MWPLSCAAVPGWFLLLLLQGLAQVDGSGRGTRRILSLRLRTQYSYHHRRSSLYRAEHRGRALSAQNVPTGTGYDAKPVVLRGTAAKTSKSCRRDESQQIFIFKVKAKDKEIKH